MGTVVDGILFFQDNKKLYGLIYYKDETHNLKIQKKEVSVCLMGHKDEMNVGLALRKSTANCGG